MLLFPFCVIQYAHVPCVTGFQHIFFFLKIVIEGIRGQSYKGDIAIDDLRIDDSPCPPEGHFFFFAWLCIIGFWTDFFFLKILLRFVFYNCNVNRYFINTGSCDFEQKSFCTWLNVPNGNRSVGLDDFDWTLGSGSTPSFRTGPSSDHTTGTAVGKLEKNVY